MKIFRTKCEWNKYLKNIYNNKYLNKIKLIDKIVVEHLGEIFTIEKVNLKTKKVEVDNGDEFDFKDVTFLKPIPLKELKNELVVEKL